MLLCVWIAVWIILQEEFDMRAFVNSEVTKDQLVEALEKHKKLDSFIQGSYSRSNGTFKGCDVGCTLHDFAPGKEDQHKMFPKLFSISERFSYLCDSLFEILPLNKAKEFPLKRTKALSVGCDTDLVVDKFLLWLLSGDDSPISKWNKETYIKNVAGLYQRKLREDNPTKKEWAAARDAAGAARDAAWVAKADKAATKAADAAAWAADEAIGGDDVVVAVRAAADAAAWAAAAGVAMADKLIKILEERI